MTTLADIDIYSHSVRWKTRHPLLVSHLSHYVKNHFAQWERRPVGFYSGRRQFKNMIARYFIGMTHTKTVFWFHRNDLSYLQDFLRNKGFGDHHFSITDHSLSSIETISLNYHDERTPYPDQKKVIDYILSPGKTKVVTLEPGRGKTFIALRAINELKVRSVFIIKPMYLRKWVLDIQEAFSIDQKDIRVVQGSPELKKLIEDAVEGLHLSPFILISNKTFLRFLKTYETEYPHHKEYGYGCSPIEFLPLLKAGIRVIDEVHQDFHLAFRIDLYSHVPKTLSMSGTLISDDPFIRKMYEVMFPIHSRLHVNTKDVYVTAEALLYSIEHVNQRINCINPSLQVYSHVRFEQSILNNKGLTLRYFNFIEDIVNSKFMMEKEPGQRLIVYFSTIQMCTLFTQYLKRFYPDEKIYRYIGEDDYDEMMEHEVIISTIKSLGTAFDVPGLYKIINTDSVSSSQANYQLIGRLRRLKEWPEVTPEFLYLVCVDIPKQMKYFRKRQRLFADRVLEHKSTYTHVVL